MVVPVPDEVILGILKSKPTHGYELLDVFNNKAKLGRIWTMRTSQVYAVLKRLERKGAISGREEIVSNAPSRMIYSITEKGNNQLEEWLFTIMPSSSIHLMRVLFISRIYIAMLLDYPLDTIINYQKKALIDQLTKFEQESKKAGNPIEHLTIKFVIGQINAALLWLNECENSIITEKDY